MAQLNKSHGITRTCGSHGSEDIPTGVMQSNYALNRQIKPHLRFRLRMRAAVACNAFRRCRKTSTASVHVLDLGAADGATLCEMHSLLKAGESIGIEYSQDLINQSRSMSSACRLVQGDVTKPHPDIEPESFELVTALAILEHLSEPHLMMSNVCRYLLPGGVFVATSPIRVWDKLSGALRLHNDEFHQASVEKNGFNKLARTAGLDPIDYRLFMFAPVGVLPYLRIPVSPGTAIRFDDMLRPFRILNFLFVNQLFVAMKPKS